MGSFPWEYLRVANIVCLEVKEEVWKKRKMGKLELELKAVMHNRGTALTQGIWGELYMPRPAVALKLGHGKAGYG
jgi:hypothetical protein